MAYNGSPLIAGEDLVDAPWPADARRRVLDVEASKIREVANAGMGRKDVLAFWFGESDLPTPDFICKAAAMALEQGRTFYTHNLGIAELRETIAAYTARVHGVTLPTSRIVVTSSGVTGLMTAMQAVIDPGDKVVVVTPVWPNLTGIPMVLGADVTCVSLDVRDGVWHLDTDRLIGQLTAGVRALVINSPSNPTGWQIERDQQRRLMEHCRRHGIWIIADEVYERLTFTSGAHCAPSFLSIANPEDRLIGQQLLEGVEHDRLAFRLASFARPGLEPASVS